MPLEIGDRAPSVDLPDTSGRRQRLPGAGEAAATVVIWTCNHCPYALAWHDRLEAVVSDYRPLGVAFVAINSNDAERYPHDSPEAMADRVSAGDFSEPFLHDADQSVARAFGAERTPDLFVFDRETRLAYRGAPDSDWDDPSLDATWLRAALDALAAGDSPDPASTTPVGCTIKWLPEPSGRPGAA